MMRAFLHHLIIRYRQFKKIGSFPKVSFKTLPNISNARWNDRATFALLAYILHPEFQQSAKVSHHVTFRDNKGQINSNLCQYGCCL